MVFTLSGAPPERIRECGTCCARVCGGGACGWCAAFALFQQILVLHGRSLPVVPGLDDDADDACNFMEDECFLAQEFYD